MRSGVTPVVEVQFARRSRYWSSLRERQRSCILVFKRERSTSMSPVKTRLHRSRRESRGPVARPMTRSSLASNSFVIGIAADSRARVLLRYEARTGMPLLVKSLIESTAIVTAIIRNGGINVARLSSQRDYFVSIDFVISREIRPVTSYFSPCFLRARESNSSNDDRAFHFFRVS